MVVYRIQRNSSIGSWEAKTARQAVKTPFFSPRKGFAGRLLRPIAAALLLGVCTFTTLSGPTVPVISQAHALGSVKNVDVQRADIIDDIIDVIDRILNPPPPPPPQDP